MFIIIIIELCFLDLLVDINGSKKIGNCDFFLVWFILKGFFVRFC